MIDAPIIVAVSSVVVTIIGGLFTYFNNRKMTRSQENLQSKKVDSEAFQRAQHIYSSALADIEVQLRRLREENTELILKLKRLHEENAELILMNNRQQKQLNELEILVIRMKRIMIEQGMTPPSISEQLD